jgi:molybdopterin/thiamine biosynthesis adenylyltransferase/rhodanese-related sulfurtransferase
MLSKEENIFYSRQILLNEIGSEGQSKLSNAKVLVIGAGGLGCPVLQYLVSAGVGKIGIVDGDVVDVTNLHRQILYTVDNIGMSKALVAARELRRLNPFIEIQAFPNNIYTKNAFELINNYDIIVDCTDNYSARFIINDACVLSNKIVVSGSIYRFEGQLTVFNYNNGPTLRCLFPKMPLKDSIKSCSESGVIGILPGIIGMLQANEVVKIILNLGQVLSGNILVFNSLKNSFDQFEIHKNEEFNYQELVNDKKLIENNYIQSCENALVNQISLSDFIKDTQNNKYTIIDVRNRGESPLLQFKQIRKIPLSELKDIELKIEIDNKILVVCKAGIRSTQALEILKRKAIKNEAYSLLGGVTQDFIVELKKLENDQKLF